jgi:hypothetical protein
MVDMDRFPTTASSIATSNPSESTPGSSAGASAPGCASSWRSAAGGGDGGGAGSDGSFVRIWTGDESSVKKRRFLAGLSSGCGDSIARCW